MMPSERTSVRANASVASVEIIGVRRVVSAAPSSRATGWPIRMSNNTYTPWMIGNPRAGLAGWMPTSLTPAASPQPQASRELAAARGGMHPIDV